MDSQRQKRLKETYPDYLEDLEDILKTKEGRRFIMHIIESCQTETNVFSNDSMCLSYMEGMRHVGTVLLNDVRILNDGFSLECTMRQEDASAKRDRRKPVVDETQAILDGAF